MMFIDPDVPAKPGSRTRPNAGRCPDALLRDGSGTLGLHPGALRIHRPSRNSTAALSRALPARVPRILLHDGAKWNRFPAPPVLASARPGPGNPPRDRDNHPRDRGRATKDPPEMGAYPP